VVDWSCGFVEGPKEKEQGTRYKAQEEGTRNKAQEEGTRNKAQGTRRRHKAQEEGTKNKVQGTRRFVGCLFYMKLDTEF
jgi:hypothetical protein